MAVVPIHVEVEDIAVGPVLIALRKMQGVIKFHVDLDGFGPSSSTPRLPGGPSVQETIIAILLQHGEPITAAGIAEKTGLVKTSVYSGLNSLKTKGIVKLGADKAWQLTEKAARDMGAVKLLPKPRTDAAAANGVVRSHHGTNGTNGMNGKKPKIIRAKQGAAWSALHSGLVNGPLKRENLITHMTQNGVKAKSASGILERAQRDKLAKTNGGGIWELTAKGIAKGNPEQPAAGE